MTDTIYKEVIEENVELRVKLKEVLMENEGLKKWMECHLNQNTENALDPKIPDSCEVGGI